MRKRYAEPTTMLIPKRIGHLCRQVLIALCALIPLALAGPVFSQTPAADKASKPAESTGPRLSWWNLGDRVVPERGKFAELKARKKIYVEVTVTNDAAATQPIATADRNEIQRNEIQGAVADAIDSNKSLQRVGSGALAELSMLVRVSTVARSEGGRPNLSLTVDPESETTVDVIVLIPGIKRPDGTVRPRQVWEGLNPSSQIEPSAAARFTVDGFLWELKKLAESKK